MADGGMTIQLSDYSAAKLVERAKAMGVAPEILAAMLLDDQLFSSDDFKWINGDPRDPEPPFNPDETTFAWADVKAGLTRILEDGLARKTRVAGQK